LRAVLSYAEREDIVARSPVKGIWLTRVSLVSRPVLGAEQLHVVAEALGPDQAPMMWLGVVLGLRWGEIGGLRVGRVDFDNETVTVAEQLVPGPQDRATEVGRWPPDPGYAGLADRRPGQAAGSPGIRPR